MCVSPQDVYQFHSSYCTRLSIIVHVRSYTTLFCSYRTSASDEPTAAAHACSSQPRSALPHRRPGEIPASNCYCRVTVMPPEVLLCVYGVTSSHVPGCAFIATTTLWVLYPFSFGRDCDVVIRSLYADTVQSDAPHRHQCL